MRGQVEESLVQALRVGAAKLMFDDYATIGNTSGNIIHLYQLSGKFIPSSAVFKALAKASTSAVSVKAKVTLPSKIDPFTNELWKGLSDKAGKDAIIAQWNKQFIKAKKESEWAAYFTIHVKEVLAWV